MNPAILRQYLAIGREFGLKSLETEGCKVEFGPLPLTPEELKRKVPIGDEEQAPTEEQFLYLSCGYEPEIKAEADPDERRD